MNIQSLSVVVPTKNKCVNNCKFCVSRTHTNPYDDKVSNCFRKGENVKEFSILHDVMLREGDSDNVINYRDYFNRLQYSRDNGCNVAILTGTGEPIQNVTFLKFFSYVNFKLTTPFKSIEFQSTGVLLNDKNLKLLRKLGITTISLSISDLFDNKNNLELIGCKKSLYFEFEEVIKSIKKYDFNLRLSLNLVNVFDEYSVDEVLNKCKELGADQVTFRELYKSNNNSEIDNWIEENSSSKFYKEISDYIKGNGSYLGKLPFGALIYDIKEMSVVLDSDCMNEEIKDTYKYLILRENCKLYSKWETKASLIF